MKHPFEKWILIETLSIVLAVLLGIIAMIKGIILLIFFALISLATGFACEAIIAWSMKDVTIAAKQCLRAGLVTILSIYTLFTL